ncbi:MAG: molybdopterin-dependent oxidoreductase [Acidobacteriota bacterium]
MLKILGLGGAAGLTGCSTTAPDPLVPYVTPPEEVIRGHALWYRTTCRECPAGCGIQARVREGRVHKVEGNPEHPVNAGGLCARGQAAVEGLYNPDRLRTPLVRDAAGALKPASWDEALKRLAAGLGKLDKNTICVLTGCVTGALAELAALVGRHVQYEPLNYEALRAANQRCFGVAALPVYRFAEARTICVFGADVLETFLSPVGYARGIAEARRAGARLVYVGSRLSLTGARADQWVPVPPGGEGAVAMALVDEVRARGGGAPGVPREVIAALAQELIGKPALAVTGGAAMCDEQAVETAVAVNLLNAVTGAINQTVRFDRGSALDRTTSRPELPDCQAVLIAGCNPAYSAPGFAERLRKVPLVVVLSPYQDETVELAHIVLPVHTPLESWGDYEPWTGLHSLQQPAMRPVFDTRDVGDILLSLARPKPPEASFHEYLRSRWRAPWTAALQRGGYWREVPARPVKLAAGATVSLKRTRPEGFVLQTYPSLAHFDGRGANRPWLQELPDPVTQVVWDAWVEVNPKDAQRLNVATGDRVSLRSARGEIELPVYVYPGIVPGAVAVPLGQGHTAYGRYATGVGADPRKLLPPERFSGEPVQIALVQRKAGLVVAAGHDLQEHREIARSREVPSGADDRFSSSAIRGTAHPSLSLYPPHTHQPHRWAMVIDLDACTGCSACVTACYAENNLPVVGRYEAGRGRLMSWIRLERFFGPGSSVSEPFRIDFIPMLCQHCDHAPCEPVCPVYAAYHTAEGLNGQVYNRCVGTRYCANNCPYKVRRFNWYPAQWPSPLEWQLNPDVTVRTKGVMEKCTFCIQRIVEGKDRARREGRAVRDGDIVPACAQSCPSQAIVFGDVIDKASRVNQARANARGYTVFEMLNTRPAVTYLERERRRA